MYCAQCNKHTNCFSMDIQFSSETLTCKVKQIALDLLNITVYVDLQWIYNLP